jgi:putative ABC transport system permease protein
MFALEAVRTALAMIRAHKLRAFFTVLGTVVGVTFLIAVITLIKGMDAYMKEDFASTVYGINTVQIRRTPSVQMGGDMDTWRAWRRRPRLSFDDARWLEERMETPGFVSISSVNRGDVSSPEGNTVSRVMVTGASASYFQVRDTRLAEGRVFSEREAERGASVVVIGQEVAEKVFDGREAIGKTLRIKGHPYVVIGVLEKQGSLFGMSMDRVAIAPARSRVNGFVNPPNIVDEIVFKVPDAHYLPAAMAEIEGWMRIRHRLRPTTGNTFEVETAEESMSFWNKISQMMMIALPGLVGISLVVGGVVIMNIMLVSVTERTREIGLRKSLGARRRDILMQFLVESATLSGAGGLLGIGLGIGLAAAVSAISPIPARVTPDAIGMAIALSVGVGLIAGVYPAYRASRLDPIDALRHE